MGVRCRRLIERFETVDGNVACFAHGHILRILGYRLLQAQQPKLAVAVFRKVLDLSPEEPQSYRDLGLALNADGQPQKAIDMLYEVVVRPWHNRFPEIELITLAELNAAAQPVASP